MGKGVSCSRQSAGVLIANLFGCKSKSLPTRLAYFFVVVVSPYGQMSEVLTGVQVDSVCFKLPVFPWWQGSSSN